MTALTWAKLSRSVPCATEARNEKLAVEAKTLPSCSCVEVLVRTIQGKGGINLIGELGWGPVGPWNILACLEENALFFL